MKKLNYLLITFVIISLAGCSKKDNTTTPTPTPTPTGITVNSSWQYSAKIDGTTHANVEGSLDFQGSFGWSASLAGWPDTSSCVFGSGLNGNNSPNKSLSIDIGTAYFMGNQCDTAKFKAVIHTGSYSYTANGNNGVKISWVDANGDFWATDYGTGNQTGSSFSITDVVPVGFVLGNYELKFKATFSCKLYNYSTGASVLLTDGVYVGKFENYN